MSRLLRGPGRVVRAVLDDLVTTVFPAIAGLVVGRCCELISLLFVINVLMACNGSR